jgi:four helix bundle protein
MDKPHKKLDAWEEAISLIVLIYELADKFPKSEAFGLSSQIKRAVISIVANISEGAARQTKREFMQYLYMARGSLNEVEPLLEVARKLGYAPEESVLEIERKEESLNHVLFTTYH